MSKERLIKTIYDFFDQIDGEWTMTELANHILADGWTRPPCKVEDRVMIRTIYVLAKHNDSFDNIVNEAIEDGYQIEAIELITEGKGMEGNMLYALLIKGE